MDSGTFWVGEKPGRIYNISVRDGYGNFLNLAPYTNVEVELIDSDNRRVDLSGAVTSRIDSTTGLVGFAFPQGRSVFTKPGEYLMRVRMESESTLDYTDVATIAVREFGGVRY